MSKSIDWSYRPYKPYLFETGDIYICRVAPNETTVSIDWIYDDGGCFDVWYRAVNDDEFIKFETTEKKTSTITGLNKDCDYEFYVSCNGRKSRTRLARTGAVVGTVVNYLHPKDKAYSFSGNFLCSPSIVRHPNGCLLASMDVYECDAPQNLTLIFRSDDDGKTWYYVSELMPCFWGKMFIHKGDLYMLSCSTEYGDLLIGKSTDCGKTFSAPTVLLRGSGNSKKPGVHKNPQNMVRFNGRIYETLEWGAWSCGSHSPMVMSCDENDDLLDADNWHITPPIKYNPQWEGVAKGESAGNIEGTLAVAPDGNLYNVMRYDTTRCEPSYGLVLAYRVNTENPDAPLEYSHAIKFPCNLSKFMIKYDKKSGKYLSLASRIYDSEKIGARNLLSLMVSDDMENWYVAKDVIDMRETDHTKVGFQYVDFEIEGDDIIFLSRTAMNNANSFHDSNYQTFHRIENFRKYL